MLVYNDAIGAFFSWVANGLGWSLEVGIIAYGFWKFALYVVRQARDLLAAAKREWREATGA